ncbi:MAG TPA: MCE family protein, partial [Acidimicrobiales bacterium]|nr:MCE family protein [Acidimicrobiales bacterium]
HGFQVPTDAQASLRPKSLFGNEEVLLHLPRGDHGPFLATGQSLPATGKVFPAVNNLIATAVPLLRSVNTRDLATVLSNLDAAVRGEGPAIARSIGDNAALSGLLSRTIQDQLVALQSFDRFQQAIENEGPVFNKIANLQNQALPPLTAAEGALQHMLMSLQPVSEDLAQLLADYRPSMDKLISSGASVSRVLIANQANIQALVTGLYHYTDKVAHAVSPTALPDGSHVGSFKVFVMFNQVNGLVCGLLAPLTTTPQGAPLRPMLEKLAASGSKLNCSSYLAAVPRGPSTATATGPVAPSPNQALQGLANRVYTQLGKPQVVPPANNGLQTLLGNTLAGSL